MNQVQHLEDNENNGFRMKNILAINRHWHDVLLDYYPKKLTIHQRISRQDKLMQKLRDMPLNGLKHVQIVGITFLDLLAGCYSTQEKKWAEILKILNQKNFSLTSVVLKDFAKCETNMPDLMEFFDKHCSHLKQLELHGCYDTCYDTYPHNINHESFVSIISRTGFYDTNPSREIYFMI